MTRTLIAVLALIGLASTPAIAEVRFEDRAGVLYVTNVERPAAPTLGARAASPMS